MCDPVRQCPHCGEISYISLYESTAGTSLCVLSNALSFDGAECAQGPLLIIMRNCFNSNFEFHPL